MSVNGASGEPKIEVVLGDISREVVDVVVNAANAALSGGGGVDGAIHRAAGPELLAHCLTLGGRAPGQCVITPGFGLAARYIVHAVGPVWSGGERQEEELLRSCYHEALKLASDVGARSIAFPAISCGAYRFPVDRAARVAAETIRGFNLSASSIKVVRNVCFEPSTVRIFQKAFGAMTQR